MAELRAPTAGITINFDGKYPPAEPAFFYEPLKTASALLSGLESGSVSQSPSGIGSKRLIATPDCNADSEIGHVRSMSLFLALNRLMPENVISPKQNVCRTFGVPFTDPSQPRPYDSLSPLRGSTKPRFNGSAREPKVRNEVGPTVRGCKTVGYWERLAYAANYLRLWAIGIEDADARDNEIELLH